MILDLFVGNFYIKIEDAGYYFGRSIHITYVWVIQFQKVICSELFYKLLSIVLQILHFNSNFFECMLDRWYEPACFSIVRSYQIQVHRSGITDFQVQFNTRSCAKEKLPSTFFRATPSWNHSIEIIETPKLIVCNQYTTICSRMLVNNKKKKYRAKEKYVL